MIDRDKLNNTDPVHAAHASIAVLDRLQYFPQHIQATAAAVVFLVLAEHFKVPAQDIFTATKNMINAEDGIAEFRAVQDYVKYEIKRA